MWMGAGPMLALGNSELAGVEELLSLWFKKYIIYGSLDIGGRKNNEIF